MERKDSRIPVPSITMSSSIAADTATPRMASSVRVRCRTRAANARAMVIAASPAEELERPHGDETHRGGRACADPQHERQDDGEDDDAGRDEREDERRPVHGLVMPVDDR